MYAPKSFTAATNELRNLFQMRRYVLHCCILLVALARDHQSDLNEVAAHRQVNTNVYIHAGNALFPIDIEVSGEISYNFSRTIEKKIKKIQNNLKTIKDTAFRKHTKFKLNYIIHNSKQIKLFLQNENQKNVNGEAEIKKRSKRSLLDIGGKVLKSLFGVATEEDLEKAMSSLRNMSEQNRISTTKITLQTENIRIAVQSMIDTMKNQILTHEATYNMYSYKFNLNNEVETMIMVTNHVVSIINHYKKNLKAIHTHKVPIMFNRDQIRNIFKQALQLFNGMFIPLNATTDTIESLHEYLSISKTDDAHLYILSVPLVKKNPYNITEFASLPVKNDGGRIFKINNLDRFLIESRTDFFTSSTNLKCKIFESFEICEAPLKLSTKMETNICAYNIINNSTLGCQFEPYHMPGELFATKLYDSWYVFTKQRVTALYVCSNQTLLKDFIGLTKLAPDCTLTSKTVQLSSIQDRKSKFDIKIDNESFPKLVTTNISLLRDKELFHKNATILQLKKLREAFNLTSQNVSVHRADLQWHIQVVYTGLGGLSLFVIIMFLLLCVFCLVRRKEKHHDIRRG